MNNSVIQELVNKTLEELKNADKPQMRSRVWTDPEGYQYLAVWQNAALLRVLVRKFTGILPKKEFRLKAQMDDCARSVKRNIEEGWKRATTSEYLQFLSFSQGSLEEVKGDIRDCKTDGFLPSKPGSSLKGLGFGIDSFKGPGKNQVKGEPTDPGHPYELPLKTLNPTLLTYEVFMELTNKTDWLLRKLVESLESKLTGDQKAYQLEQARIRSNLKFKG